MADAPVFILPTGNTVRLGLRRRTFEPASVKYNFSNYLRAPAVDLTQPMFFWSAVGKPDVRMPCEDQKSMGACSAFGGGNAAAEAYAMGGGQPVDLDKDWLYFAARRKENGGQPNPNDAGSDPADVLDYCMSGVPPQSVQSGGYVDNPATDYSSLDSLATLKYVASFHAVYPTDGDMRTFIWQALASGYPVNMASLWCNAMFSPSNGLMPQGLTSAMEVGGHDYRCFGWIPAKMLPASYQYGGYACRNNWTAQWGGAEKSGITNLQAGDFILPAEYGNPNSLIEVAYAVVGVSAPTPQPTPTPTPTPVPANCAPAAQAIALAEYNAMMGQYAANRITLAQATTAYTYIVAIWQADGALSGMTAASAAFPFPAPVAR